MIQGRSIPVSDPGCLKTYAENNASSAELSPVKPKRDTIITPASAKVPIPLDLLRELVQTGRGDNLLRFLLAKAQELELGLAKPTGSAHQEFQCTRCGQSGHNRKSKNGICDEPLAPQLVRNKALAHNARVVQEINALRVQKGLPIWDSRERAKRNADPKIAQKLAELVLKIAADTKSGLLSRRQQKRLLFKLKKDVPLLEMKVAHEKALQYKRNEKAEKSRQVNKVHLPVLSMQSREIKPTNETEKTAKNITNSVPVQGNSSGSVTSDRSSTAPVSHKPPASKRKAITKAQRIPSGQSQGGSLNLRVPGSFKEVKGGDSSYVTGHARPVSMDNNQDDCVYDPFYVSPKALQKEAQRKAQVEIDYQKAVEKAKEYKKRMAEKYPQNYAKATIFPVKNEEDGDDSVLGKLF